MACFCAISRFEGSSQDLRRKRNLRKLGATARGPQSRLQILEVSLISKSCSIYLSILNNRKKGPHHMGDADKWADPRFQTEENPEIVHLHVPRGSLWLGPQIGISYLVHLCTIFPRLHAHLLAAPLTQSPRMRGLRMQGRCTWVWSKYRVVCSFCRCAARRGTVSSFGPDSGLGDVNLAFRVRLNFPVALAFV